MEPFAGDDVRTGDGWCSLSCFGDFGDPPPPPSALRWKGNRGGRERGQLDRGNEKIAEKIAKLRKFHNKSRPKSKFTCFDLIITAPAVSKFEKLRRPTFDACRKRVQLEGSTRPGWVRCPVNSPRVPRFVFYRMRITIAGPRLRRPRAVGRARPYHRHRVPLRTPRRWTPRRVTVRSGGVGG